MATPIEPVVVKPHHQYLECVFSITRGKRQGQQCGERSKVGNLCYRHRAPADRTEAQPRALRQSGRQKKEKKETPEKKEEKRKSFVNRISNMPVSESANVEENK